MISNVNTEINSAWPLLKNIVYMVIESDKLIIDIMTIVLAVSTTWLARS